MVNCLSIGRWYLLFARTLSCLIICYYYCFYFCFPFCVFEVRGFCIESKILLTSSLRVPESAFTINRYADKEIKLVLWFYRMHTAHNIKWVLYGFLCEYLFLYISMPLYCYSWDVFSSLSFSFSSALHSFCSVFTWVRTLLLLWHVLSLSRAHVHTRWITKATQNVYDETYLFVSFTQLIWPNLNMVAVVEWRVLQRRTCIERNIAGFICSVHIYILKIIIMCAHHFV